MRHWLEHRDALLLAHEHEHRRLALTEQMYDFLLDWLQQEKP